MRLMVDEARQANSCVRTSAHGTVHDPRDATTCRAQLRCRGLRCHPQESAAHWGADGGVWVFRTVCFERVVL